MGFANDYFLKVIEGAPILISFIKSNHWDSQTITFWKLSKVRQFWFLLWKVIIRIHRRLLFESYRRCANFDFFCVVIFLSKKVIPFFVRGNWTGLIGYNVTPIFKKGKKGILAENYRSVSLTCITCKLFEHIVCRHILDHVEDHKILTNLQHGFRSGRSCETQL